MSKGFKAIKAEKWAVWPWLSCQVMYQEYAHGQAVLLPQVQWKFNTQWLNLYCMF